MRRKRAFTEVAGGAALLGLLILAGGSGAAAVPNSAGSDAGSSNPIPPGPWKNQARLLDAADHVRSAMEKRDSSYTGITIDPDANVLTLYVHGSPVAACHRALQAEAGKGFRIVVSQAPYSRPALDQAQDKLWQQRDALGIVSLAAREDGTGLVAGVTTSSATGPVQSPADPQGVRSATDIAGVPVAVQQNGSMFPARTRLDDQSPFWGGARIVGALGCTSSFGVGDANGTYLVTAAHCVQDGVAVATGAGRLVGFPAFNARTQGKQLDAALIRASVEGYIYDHTYNDSTGYRKPVAGWARPSVGMYVCTSGSYSGTLCNIKVTYMGQRTSYGGYTVYQDLAEQQNHTSAGGEGDSGAPVFTVSPSDNYARMTVVGTLTTGSDAAATPCVGLQNRKCSWAIGFARFDNLRIYANLTYVATRTS